MKFGTSFNKDIALEKLMLHLSKYGNLYQCMDGFNGKKIILQRVKELYPTVMENVSVLCPKMMKYSKGPIVLEFV